MKRILIVLCVCLMLLAAGCVCRHEWKDATCTEPKTCTKCGETEGEPLGHDWKDATCTEPKTCAVCKETEGEPLGHDWKDATCTEPKTCAVCKETEGEPLGHDWKDATCTEPKTCAVCKETEGEPKGHDASWETVKVDAVNAVRTLESKCLTCGEVLDSKDENMTSLVEGDRFLFTPEEFTRRLQTVWDDARKDQLTMQFKYSINSSGNQNFDIYNKNDVWFGWGMFYDKDGKGIEATSDAPINSMTVFIGPVSNLDDDTLYYLLSQMAGPVVSAVDPTIPDGTVYEDPVLENTYSSTGDKSLNGVHYGCGYKSDSHYFLLFIDIADNAD